jgi:uncharacterized protein YqeY
MLMEQINRDFVQSLKIKDDFSLSVLRMLKAAILNAAIEKKRKVLETDEEVIEVIKREIKKLKDSLEDFKKGERLDLIEKTEKEIAILEKYLPAQLSEEKIKEIVKEMIDKLQPSGPSDFGKVMGAVMKEIKGQADGAVVKKVVEELLKK